MAKNQTHASVSIVLHNGEPCIESRLRAVDDEADGPIPKGKILVMRTPLLTPGSGEEDTERELIDDDGSAEAFCPECAAAGYDPHEVEQQLMAAAATRRVPRKYGRNDPCPCGSGRKYKRCCLN
jgi:hypothetical protein